MLVAHGRKPREEKDGVTTRAIRRPYRLGCQPKRRVANLVQESRVPMLHPTDERVHDMLKQSRPIAITGKIRVAMPARVHRTTINV